MKRVITGGEWPPPPRWYVVKKRHVWSMVSLPDDRPIPWAPLDVVSYMNRMSKETWEDLISVNGQQTMAVSHGVKNLEKRTSLCKKVIGFKRQCAIKALCLEGVWVAYWDWPTNTTKVYGGWLNFESEDESQDEGLAVKWDYVVEADHPPLLHDLKRSAICEHKQGACAPRTPP